ncbi:MAG: DUF4271 domain-containing protein [Janthinobacterium lividum]
MPARAAEYRPLPPVAATGISTSDWLLHDAPNNRLILYLPGYHAPAHAYYQWVQLRPRRPFRLKFEAGRGLSLFLDNQLVFSAPTPGSYAIDLAAFASVSSSKPRLLAVWQPQGYPALNTFTTEEVASTVQPVAQPAARWAMVRSPASAEPVLLLALLALGLLYGIVRSAYPAGLSRIMQLNEVFGSSAEPQSFLARPAFTWLNFGLLLLFAFSLALLLTALRTDLSSLLQLQQLFNLPETSLGIRVLLYASIILIFVLGKYFLVELLSYIFDLRSLVNVHYREFLRTTLLLGLPVPLVLLLCLSLSAHWPPVVSMAKGFILLLLTLTVLRVARTLHQRASLLNLHLFAYLCATEILPLAVLLKLIVFTYSA